MFNGSVLKVFWGIACGSAGLYVELVHDVFHDALNRLVPRITLWFLVCVSGSLLKQQRDKQRNKAIEKTIAQGNTDFQCNASTPPVISKHVGKQTRNKRKQAHELILSMPSFALLPMSFHEYHENFIETKHRTNHETKLLSAEQPWSSFWKFLPVAAVSVFLFLMMSIIWLCYAHSEKVLIVLRNGKHYFISPMITIMFPFKSHHPPTKTYELSPAQHKDYHVSIGNSHAPS